MLASFSPVLTCAALCLTENEFTRHWYEKDKLIPVNPANVPNLDEEKLAPFPFGYRYLAYCQEAAMGVKVLSDMPGHRRNADTIN